MNIIFGKENINHLDSKYTVLELDTIKLIPQGTLIPTFCLVENVPILHMSRVENMKNLHENLLINYRKRDWNYCNQALEHLVGFWGSEMDSFYMNLQARIHKYMEQDPGDTWDGTIEKTAVGQ